MGNKLMSNCFNKKSNEEESSVSNSEFHSEKKSLVNSSFKIDKKNKEVILERKVLIIGDQAVGKSSILERFNKGKYSEDGLKSTLGASFSKCKLNVKGEEIFLNIWDTAGDKKFMGISEVFYKGTDAVVLVFDCSNQETYNNIPMWIQHIQNYLNLKELHGMALVSNKSDLKNDKTIALNKLAKSYSRNNQIIFFETSAKTGEGVEELFSSIAKQLLQKSRV